ncbi:hypothetical protein ACWDX6_23870 [Streptomyces sp. NPDC003027]
MVHLTDMDPPSYVDTHPAPDVTLRTYVNEPRWDVYVTGWFVRRYRTERGALARIEREARRHN